MPGEMGGLWVGVGGTGVSDGGVVVPGVDPAVGCSPVGGGVSLASRDPVAVAVDVGVGDGVQVDSAIATEGVNVGLRVGSGVGVRSGPVTSWTMRTAPTNSTATTMAMPRNMTRRAGPLPFPLVLACVLLSWDIASTLGYQEPDPAGRILGNRCLDDWAIATRSKPHGTRSRSGVLCLWMQQGTGYGPCPGSWFSRPLLGHIPERVIGLCRTPVAVDDGRLCFLSSRGHHLKVQVP